MKVDIFYDTPTGIRIFSAIGRMYFGMNEIYPTTDKQLPKYITELGYPCSYANVKPPIVPVERVGITLDEETATALVLRYG